MFDFLKLDKKKAIRLANTLGALVILASIGFFLMPEASTSITEPPNIEITIRGGDLDDKFGFALEGDEELTTPGPTIYLKKGDVVKLTFENVGEIPHNFAIVESLEDDAKVLFNSRAGTVFRTVPPGESKSVIFRADKAGEFYYMCEVPGHHRRGMRGDIVVEE